VSVIVADVLNAVFERFPEDWAEPWDQVGLLVGDPQAEVTRVLVTLDPSSDALSRAKKLGVQVLLTHHPAYLTPPARFVPDRAGPSFHAAASGIALIAAHTNLDRAPDGAATLPRLLGLEPGVPLEESLLPVSLVTAFVPPGHEVPVSDAMARAGAGRIGQYEGCSFSISGTGRFTPASSAQPHTGTPGQHSVAEETRVEMVAPRARVSAVIAAARQAHPYEEPLIAAADAVISRGQARMGRVSELSTHTVLSGFVDQVARTFDVTPRVWGPAERPIRRVATATGSAGSLVSAAIDAGADVLVAGEVRYHDAQAGLEAGLCVIEVGHDVSEWPLVPVLAEALAQAPGLGVLDIVVDEPATGCWTPGGVDDGTPGNTAGAARVRP
jgi:dinuclear metal center YbgI/SA1388 family protein